VWGRISHDSGTNKNQSIKNWLVWKDRRQKVHYEGEEYLLPKGLSVHIYKMGKKQKKEQDVSEGQKGSGTELANKKQIGGGGAIPRWGGR